MGRPIRILLTISDFFGGGAEREFANLVRWLPRSRFEPHMCLWRSRFDYPPPDDVPTYVLEKWHSWDAFRTVRRLARLIDDLQPDLVFSQLHYVSILTGMALRFSRHRPRWVCRIANNPVEDIRFPMRTWASWSLRRADRVAGCSIGVSTALMQHLRLDRDRVCTLRNLVDLESIRLLASQDCMTRRAEDEFIVVHAGRMCAQKNQIMLLEAFSRLRGHPARLWMLGKGPLESALRGRAESLGIADQVTWLGFQPNPYPWFRAADCFALSSNFEGLPNCIIESFACGTPVVSTRCPFGPEELVQENTNGLLTAPGNTQAMADALWQMYGEHDRNTKMRIAATTHAQRFHRDEILPSYECLFAEVMQS